MQSSSSSFFGRPATAMMAWLAFICLVGVHTTSAYRVEKASNLVETETCRMFKVKPKENYQMHAFSVEDDTEMSSSDVAEACRTRLSEDGGFEMLMTKYPSKIRYSLAFDGVRDLNESYRFTALASWGDLSDAVRAECDYEGNAYFAVPARISGGYIPQGVSSMDWTPSEAKTFQDEFALQLNGNEGSAPIFGDGFLISAALCQIRPKSSSSNQKIWPARDTLFPVTFAAEIEHWWGLLHPEMYSELLLLAVIALPKFLLVVWFFYRCRMFKDHVMTQQKYFLWVSLFSFSASFAFTMFLVAANINGIETCCPLQPSTAFFMGLKVMSNMAFNLLVLATAKGWGVVNPKLSSADTRSILAFFGVTLILYILSRVLRPSLEIAYLQVLNETSIWGWIFISLRRTRYGLMTSSRLDRHAKIEMYTKLHKLLLIGLFLWGLIVTIVVWVILIVYNQEGRLIIFDIPPTLAWDLTALGMMWGFGWIWRPSPSTAQFAYSFARQEGEGIGSDPVTEFGMELS